MQTLARPCSPVDGLPQALPGSLGGTLRPYFPTVPDCGMLDSILGLPFSGLWN